MPGEVRVGELNYPGVVRAITSKHDRLVDYVWWSREDRMYKQAVYCHRPTNCLTLPMPISRPGKPENLPTIGLRVDFYRVREKPGATPIWTW